MGNMKKKCAVCQTTKQDAITGIIEKKGIEYYVCGICGGLTASSDYLKGITCDGYSTILASPAEDSKQSPMTINVDREDFMAFITSLQIEWSNTPNSQEYQDFCKVIELQRAVLLKKSLLRCMCDELQRVVLLKGSVTKEVDIPTEAPMSIKLNRKELMAVIVERQIQIEWSSTPNSQEYQDSLQIFERVKKSNLSEILVTVHV